MSFFYLVSTVSTQLSLYKRSQNDINWTIRTLSESLQTVKICVQSKYLSRCHLCFFFNFFFTLCKYLCKYLSQLFPYRCVKELPISYTRASCLAASNSPTAISKAASDTPCCHLFQLVGENRLRGWNRFLLKKQILEVEIFFQSVFRKSVVF